MLEKKIENKSQNRQEYSLWKYAAREEAQRHFEKYLKLKTSKKSGAGNIKMVNWKERLEELAKNNIGIRLKLPELLEPFKFHDNLEIHTIFIGRALYKIYYCLDAAADGNYPKKLVNGKYRQVFAIYENSRLKTHIKSQ